MRESEPLLTRVTYDEQHTQTLAAALAARCNKGDCLLLSGDLGAGKTSFARGFIRAMGCREEVTSPTFTLMQAYDTSAGVPITHYDLYRVEKPGDIEALALDEALENGITLIEWPDIAEKKLPSSALSITLKHERDSARRVEMRGDPALWQSRLETIV